MLPVFDKYSLLTHKQLDYRDWRKAIILKQKWMTQTFITRKTSGFNTYYKIVYLKKNMNNLELNMKDIIYLMI